MTMLATVEGLRSLLKEDAAGLTDDDATLLVELATGAVQAAARQNLVRTTDDTITLMGTQDQWLDLPQGPVTAVTAVAIDGVAVTVGTDYKRFGARLWRRRGWARCDEPSEVTVTYTHGYEDWDPKLGLARSAVLTVAARMFANPIGATGLSIDDYSQQFSGSSNSDLSGMVPAHLQAVLRRTYGPRARMVRIG